MKKQIYLLIRYWSPTRDEVCCRYYKSLFFSHADGKTVASKMFKSMQSDCLSLESLVSLGSDGPNVNKTIFRELSKCIKQECQDWNGLVNIDTCNLHSMHNAFSKGIEQYGQETEDLAIALFGLFKISSGRREDYREIQVELDLPEEVFVKHSQVRWLSIGPSLKKIVEQREGIKTYVTQLEKDSRKMPKSVNFKLIRDAVNNPDMKVKLQFLLSVIPLFEQFLQDFQTDQPMIHVLYSRMKDLLFTILRRFVKGDIVNSMAPEDLKSADLGISNQLSDEDIVMGAARQELSGLKNESHKHREILGVRSFYLAVAKYMIRRLPLDNKVLKAVTCLSPVRRFDESSVSDVEVLARELYCDEETVVHLVDE